MKAFVRKTAAFLVLLLALAAILTQPTWSFLQVLGLLALGPALFFLLGGLAAFFAYTLALALQLMTVESENAFFFVFLPLWCVFSLGGLLACVVLRSPSLGRKIDMGPFGPGGI